MLRKKKATVRMSFRFPREVFDDLGRLSRVEERTKTAIVVRAIRAEIVKRGVREQDLLSEKAVDEPVRSV